MLRTVLLASALTALLSSNAYSTSRCICGDSDCSSLVTTFDALAALRSAVGLASHCDRNCNCDTDSNREITTSDALDILRSAIGEESVDDGCGYIEECLFDDDCPDGFRCGDNPEWRCDFVCLPVTSTTMVVGDECFEDIDCWDDYPGWYCGGPRGYECVECTLDEHCADGQDCGFYACVPE